MPAPPRRTLWFAVLILAACGGGSRAADADVPLWELHTAAGLVRGRLAAGDAATSVLLARDGRMLHVDRADVTAVRRAGDRFAPLDRRTWEHRLRAEFGDGYAVDGTRHFVVVRPAGRVRGTYGGLLEDTYASLRGWFARHGHRTPPPEFPLTAVVFPDFDAFADYCRRDGGRPPSPQLKGYYSPRSNRLAAWEGDGPADAPAADRTARAGSILRRGSSVPPTLRETLVHESVHQVAFNTGLHERLGGTPRWVAEGLATALEADGFRTPGGGGRSGRINRERRLWFADWSARRRRPGTLRALVADGERLCEVAPLDFYAESWALTFFLMETRPGAYGRYLTRVAARPPGNTAEDRVEDFAACFGGNWERLGREYLEFMAGL